MPSSRSTVSVLAPSSHTNGRAAADIQFIGRATSRASTSGYIWPSRLGTSSPKMMVRKVITATTMAVALTAAARGLTGSTCCSHSASGAENAASPTMPYLQPRLAAGRQRHLGHRECAVQQNQENK